MNPVAFTIGSWPVYWYGILISSALVIGIFLSQRLAKERGYNLDQIWTLFLIIIPCAVIGARLYYVIFSWDMYAGQPLKIFQIWHGGLAVHGGIIGGMIAAFSAAANIGWIFGAFLIVLLHPWLWDRLSAAGEIISTAKPMAV